MADAKKTDSADGEAPKKKSKLLLMIIVGVLALVVAAAGAAFVLMSKKPADDEDADADEPPVKTTKAKKKKSGPVAPPIFTKLEPFVVKLQNDGLESYVQAVPELKLIEAMEAERIKTFMPEIRHKVLLILAGKKASELSTPEGMQILANQIRVSINATLTGEKPDPELEKKDSADDDAPVQAVFFSSLIVQ